MKPPPNRYRRGDQLLYVAVCVIVGVMLLGGVIASVVSRQIGERNERQRQEERLEAIAPVNCTLHPEDIFCQAAGFPR